MWELAAVALGAYLLGSIPSGYLLGLLHRVDVREVGSGNIGATNVARTVGRSAGLATLAIDLAKGATPVLMVDVLDHLTGADPTRELRARAVAALAAVGGHVFPITLGFRGGKGVATTFGALLALAPAVAGCAAALFAVALATTRIVSASSIVAAAGAPLASLMLEMPSVVTATSIALALLILVRHRDNVARLRSGTEPRIGSSDGDGPPRPA